MALKILVVEGCSTCNQTACFICNSSYTFVNSSYCGLPCASISLSVAALHRPGTSA